MAMRWLGRDYHSGELTDEESDERLRLWQEARAELARTETGDLARLGGEVYLSDALVESFVVSDPGRVELTVIAGDLQRGYERVELRYTGAVLVDDDGGDIADFVERGTDIVDDEVRKLHASQWEHAFILGSRASMSIRFHDVAVTTTASTATERNILTIARKKNSPSRRAEKPAR